MGEKEKSYHFATVDESNKENGSELKKSGLNKTNSIDSVNVQLSRVNT